MYSFKNDYSEGAHPSILKAIYENNSEQTESYGEDIYTDEAISILKKKIGFDNIDIHFVSGGTQANLIVISSILKSYESVIAAHTGHIHVHEAGAVEATGHKINSIITENGKITPNDIQIVLDGHIDEHMVKPRLVFISNSTEVGTIYKKKELENISEFCKKKDLLLYLDGARIGSALTSKDNDLSLENITELTDIYYIGGTKNGAFLGEAIIIKNNSFKENFRFHLKQRGALLAKGRLFGIQFIELFKDDLFYDLAQHANLMAQKLTDAFQEAGYDFLSDSSTNQIFPILPDKIIKELFKKYEFYIWSKIDNKNSAARLVTSWATKEDIVDQFISELQNL